jgi:hypothetical protein
LPEKLDRNTVISREPRIVVRLWVLGALECEAAFMPETGSPQTFISYSHDIAIHKGRVLDLSDHLHSAARKFAPVPLEPGSPDHILTLLSRRQRVDGAH